MSQPDPFPQTTPPVESTSPTVNAGDVDNARTRILVGAPAVPEAPVAASAAAARFEVLRFHAKGGMGEVSVALDRELRREVAYKQIQPQFGADAEARRRFVLEAEVTGRLEHPGIVPVYGLGVQSDGRPYYAMRFIRGDSLRDAIRAFHAADTPGRKVGERELALRGLLRRFVDVCNAVAFAHDRGWLHRDLKPANVMLGKFGETLVVDWGLARPLRSDSGAVRAAESVFPPSSLADTTQETRQGDIVGTPPYMSPEQARGDWDAVGIRSDVYGLGAVLYELLSGKPPFAGSLSEVLEAVKAGQLVPVCQRKAGVPAALAAVVSKALALRREERYGTAQELAADVERWLADEPVTAYREPLSQQVRRWGRHHRVLVTGLAVLLLTLSVGLSVGLVVVNRYWRDTQEALRREEDARKAKAAALSNAQTQTANAMGIVKVVIGELNRGLAPYPNLQELRLRLLHHAEKGLKKVLQEAGLDSLPIREQLAIHLEYGDLCLQLLDRGTELAREQYELAHVLAVRLAEADAENVEAQRDLSISHDRLGDMWLQLGNTKAALVAYQQALDVRRRLAEVDPRHAQREPDLAVSLGKLGDVRLQRGETELALDDYQQYHDICRRLVRADPKNVQAQRDLSVSLNKLGSVRLRRGDTKAALDAYQQSRDIAGRLAEADPMNAEAQRDLAASHANLGKVRLQLGDTKAALDAYQQFRDICRRLAEADPKNAQAQRNLSISHERLGDVWLQLGDTKTALDNYQQSLDVRRRLAEVDPKNAQVQRDLAAAHIKLGDVRLKLGDVKAALDAFQQFHDNARRLTEADPKNAEALRNLSISHERIGDVRLQLGDTKAALDAYQQSLALVRRLTEADPNNAQTQSDLNRSHNKVGYVQLQLGNTQAALAAYQQSLAIARRLTETDPNNAQAQRDLSVTHERLGGARLQRGETQAALDAYQQSLDVRRRLARADPNNAQAQRDLSVSLNNLGDVRLKLGDTKTALDAFQQSAGIARRLAEADPKNAQAQHDLSISFEKLGDVRLQRGETKAALDAYQQSLDVRRGLAQADPINGQAQRDLSVSYNKFGYVRQQLGDTRAALDAYQQSLALARRLAKADAHNAQAQRDLSIPLERLGDVWLKLGDSQAALDAYQQCLAVRRLLAQAEPKNAQAQRDLLVSYYKLGNFHHSQRAFADAASWYDQALAVPKRSDKPAFFAQEVAILEPLAQLCRAADKALTDPASARSLPIALRLQVLSTILPPLAKQKQHAKLLLVAELLAKEDKTPAALYDAACAVALCVPLTEKPDDKEKHAGRAVALLRQAVSAGYQDRAHLEKDSDLEPLRQRADFQKVLQSLPAKAAP